MGNKKRLAILSLIDIAILLFSYLFTKWIPTIFDPAPFSLAPGALILLPVLYLLVSMTTRLNNTIWRYANEYEYLRVWLSTMLTGTLFVGSGSLIFRELFNLPECVLFLLLSSTLVMFSRLFYRMTVKFGLREEAPTEETPKKRLLIVGAGVSGHTMAAEIQRHPQCGLEVVGMIDDDPDKLGRNNREITVIGMTEDIPQVCAEQHVDLIYIAMPSVSAAEKAHILDVCSRTRCEVKILPYYTEINDEGDILINRVRSITPEELLGRDPIEVCDDDILNFVSGRTVAITGGGGSIGSELCRQIAAHRPKRLVIIDIYENNAYAIQQELRAKYGAELDLAVYIASVRDFDKINYLFGHERPEIVLHAAAHKHVPLMEDSPEEAVKNNIFGTFNTARAAMENNVNRFILISTDKAVNPTNIMGATKRVCEMIIQYFGSISKHTTFAGVRFGNVLGSNGSVIPLFREQILERRDVTVTDPQIIRYFMTIPEASQLVLTAGAMAKGGEIFVLDMGKPVKIDDLARKMISLSGLELGKDINIKYIGLRPGEKLYEELLMNEEGLGKTANKKIFIGKLIEIEYDRFLCQLDELKALATKQTPVAAEIEAMMKVIVPTFVRPEEKAEKEAAAQT